MSKNVDIRRFVDRRRGGMDTAEYRVHSLEGRRARLTRKVFWTPREAAEWALDHGYAVDPAQVIRYEMARGLR